MADESLAEKTPNTQNVSGQAQKIGISIKKNAKEDYCSRAAHYTIQLHAIMKLAKLQTTDLSSSKMQMSWAPAVEFGVWRVS